MASKNKFQTAFTDSDGDRVKIELKELGNGELQLKAQGSEGDGERISLVSSGAFGDGVLEAFSQADSLHFAVLADLNGSGVDAAAVLAVNGGELTVITAADGVEPGGLHPQHIHGFEGAQDAVTPPPEADTDGDGFIELAEGLAFYGPVQISLTPFPTPEDDSFIYVQTFELEGTGVTADNLDEHEIVVHGMTVPPGPGEGTDGEVDGENGYLAILPVASGEIETIDIA